MAIARVLLSFGGNRSRERKSSDVGLVNNSNKNISLGIYVMFGSLTLLTNLEI